MRAQDALAIPNIEIGQMPNTLLFMVELALSSTTFSYQKAIYELIREAYPRTELEFRPGEDQDFIIGSLRGTLTLHCPAGAEGVLHPLPQATLELAVDDVLARLEIHDLVAVEGFHLGDVLAGALSQVPLVLGGRAGHVVFQGSLAGKSSHDLLRNMAEIKERASSGLSVRMGCGTFLGSIEMTGHFDDSHRWAEIRSRHAFND